MKFKKGDIVLYNRMGKLDDYRFVVKNVEFNLVEFYYLQRLSGIGSNVISDYDFITDIFREADNE